MLIGHAITTRLEFELIGSPATYARIISNLWASNGEWQHMGLLAPGWMHGCLGLHFVFARRPLWSRVRFALFGAALLLPVLSALGFLEMGRELARESRVSGPSLIAEAKMPSHSAGADATLEAGLTTAVLINHLGKEPALYAYLMDYVPAGWTGGTQRKRKWRERLSHASELIKTIVQA
jgi:hypothetical protein